MSNENTPNKGDTGLNFVLQNVEGDAKQQYTGLATLGRMLGEQGQEQGGDAQPTASDDAMMSPKSEVAHSIADAAIEAAINSNGHKGKSAAAAAAAADAETAAADADERPTSGTRRPNEIGTAPVAADADAAADVSSPSVSAPQLTPCDEHAMETAMHGAGAFDVATGLYQFQHARVATGEALYRVFDFCNKTAPSANVLVPQIAPHLSTHGVPAYVVTTDAAAPGAKDAAASSSPSPSKHKMQQQQQQQQRGTKRGGVDKTGGASAASMQQQQQLQQQQQQQQQAADKGGGEPYQCYSGRGLGNRTRGGASSSSSQHPRDFCGLHALFDSCKATIEDKPRRLPRLHIQGLQREIDESLHHQQHHHQVAAVSAVAAEESSGSSSAASAEKKTKEAAVTGSAALLLGGSPLHACLAWQTPWPFELDQLTAARGATAQQAAMEKFTPVSPIFNEQSAGGALAVSHDSIAAQMRVQQQQYQVQQQQQQQLLEQQRKWEEEEAATAVAESQGDESEKAAAARERKEKFEASELAHALSEHQPQEHKPKPPPARHGVKGGGAGAGAGGASASSGFLPRQFKVAPIPQVLPSLLTVTSARGGVQQQQQQEQQQQQQHENVDWSGEATNEGAVVDQQQQQQQQQQRTVNAVTGGIVPSLLPAQNSNIPSNQQHLTARMRSKIKNFAGSDPMSGVGALIPTHLMLSARAGEFSKHRDVKKIENTTAKLRQQLEHFKTMRRIRSGGGSTTVTAGDVELREKLAGDSPTGRNTFRQHLWESTPRGAGGHGASTSRGGISTASSSHQQQQQQSGTGGGGRPKTPPRSFLAVHGLRHSGDVPASPMLPPVRGAAASPPGHHGGAGFNDTHASTASGGGGIAMTVVSHPNVPWARRPNAGESLSARFAQSKYTEPDRARVVAALMDTA